MTKMTEVMLMADVKDLGKSGAIVKVAAGYARNKLLPQGLAAPVTEASKRRLAKLEAQRAEERRVRKAAAEALASKLTGLSVTVNAQTVDGKKLYGSVKATSVRRSTSTTISGRWAPTTRRSTSATASPCRSRSGSSMPPRPSRRSQAGDGPGGHFPVRLVSRI